MTNPELNVFASIAKSNSSTEVVEWEFVDGIFYVPNFGLEAL